MKKYLLLCVMCLWTTVAVMAQHTPEQLIIKGDISTEKPLGKQVTLLVYGLLPGEQPVTTQTNADGTAYVLQTVRPQTNKLYLKFVIKSSREMPAFANVVLGEGAEVRCDISFKPKEHTLREVSVRGNRLGNDRKIRFMHDVEGTQIFAGKKSTVSITENMLFNKAANNTRQMFRNISGIVIHEGSDGGLQLNIGSRGLNPNRSANFNMRQNGYDISADPLGYPESYYTPNADDIKELQVLRGASALLYGSQFGGMINFKLAEAPRDKKFDLRQHLSGGSYGFLSSYTRLSGTLGKFSYYASATLKRGDGYRPNSDFKSYNVLTQLRYRPNDSEKWSFDWLKYHYLEHQPGGLTDAMFNDNPRQSNRARNWFLIDWNIASLGYEKVFGEQHAQLSARMVGLYASRYALGYRDKRVGTPDPGNTERDLQKGTFRNWGAEVRFLKHFYLPHIDYPSSWSIGAKYYQAANLSDQGAGSTGEDADFNMHERNPLAKMNNRQISYSSSYRLPNLNFALFSETVLRLGKGWSIIPGVRLEYIKTGLKGSRDYYYADLSGGEETVKKAVLDDDKSTARMVFLAGLAASYKMKQAELYGNITQNYRAITFNDMRTISPALEVNPNLKDEKGFSSDIGIRSRGRHLLTYDVSAYFLYYGDRIGEYFRENPQSLGTYQRYRDNIGNGISYGVEGVVNYDLRKLLGKRLSKDMSAAVFANVAVTGSRYLKSDAGYDIQGNSMEFVPLYNMKGGFTWGYKQWRSSFQVSFTSFQYTDAANEPMDPNDAVYGIYGAIPGYCIMDLSLGYKLNKYFDFNVALQNLGNTIYMTRRATGYPGPGIIPSAPFNMMATVQFHL